MNGPYDLDDVIGDRYRIKGFVGEGGMQFVYRAEDLILQRDVALKTPKILSAEKRFKRSAIVSAQINHPNVAKTLDYFETTSRAHLIEELIDGEDLYKCLLERLDCIDPYMAAKVFHHLAKGLAASHHAGVLHRDLKPTNIMVGGGLQLTSIKITDFGIAKMANKEIEDAALGGTDTISASATAVGALPYMSPEAIEFPLEVTLKSDIWSIGAMIYELISGTKPFGQGLKAAHSIIEAKMPVFPEFLTSNPQFSPINSKLKEIIASCFAKDPNSRPSADALVAECSKICYPTAPRFTGTIKAVQYGAFGFISSKQMSDTFFHMQSVYGRRPAEGDQVIFSKFSGGKADRAHPVVCAKQTK